MGHPFQTSSIPINNNADALAVSQPVIMFNSSTADGAAITDPYAATYGGGSVAWSTIAKEIHDGAGKILCNGEGRKFLEISGFFTTAGATATIQLFGFTPVFRGDYQNIGANNVSLIECPAGSEIYLGPAYPILRDPAISSQTYTMAAVAEVLVGSAVARTGFKTGTSDASIVVPKTGGTTYYFATSVTFDARHYAYLMYVTAISAGTFIGLGRTY